MRKMKFICPRCKRRSEGRQYHAACFEAVHREEQVIKTAQKKQVDSNRRKLQSVILQSKKRLAIDRGLSQRSYNELDDAEIMWKRLMKGRSFR